MAAVMTKKNEVFLLIMVLALPLCAKESKSEKKFSILNNEKFWQVAFFDQGNSDWTNKWFADGKHVTVSNSKEGMTFTTGDKEMDPAHHGVLWTKQSFSGDLKIEFDYTRLDKENKWATLLYIQATGIGEGAYSEDISEWSSLREIPYMKTYFNNMNLLHISYAAFGKEDLGLKKDYVRARRYPVKEGGIFNKDTVISGDEFNTGLFIPNETYHVTVIKKQHQLFMEFKNEQRRKLISWDTSSYPLVSQGRIGLRQMWRKSARYKNFKVYTVTD